MGILRRATDDRKTIMLDDTDYVIVRGDISKGEFNALAAKMPQTAEGESLTVPEAMAFQEELFGTLIIGWSLAEGTPSVEDYRGLSAEAGTAIDSALAEHFSSLLPSSAEGK